MKRIYTLVLLFVVGLMHAQVGIGTTDPQGTLHIREDNGTQATPTAGTIILEHGNNGGASSIIFKSAVNAGNDYGYIMYQDDASGNGTTGENGLLTIGIENDTYNDWQDDININASGSLGINTNSPDPSSSIDLGRTNKGFLVNRVTLTGTTDTSTISNPATGLLVFNTANTSDVTQGFYYYNGSNWVRIEDSNHSYAAEVNQTSQTQASTNSNSYLIINGLTHDFTAPYSGTYQITVTGYYASVAASNGASTGQGSISLWQNTNSAGYQKLKERYVVSTTTTNLVSLAQSTTFTTNVQLTAGINYSFAVAGREWTKTSSTAGYFGRSTSSYAGSNGVTDAQYGTMTITLVAE